MVSPWTGTPAGCQWPRGPDQRHGHSGEPTRCTIRFLVCSYGYGGHDCSVSRFGPYCPRRSATCAPVRPRVASTPRFAATTSGFCRCGALIDGSVKWGSPGPAAALTGSGGRVDVAAKTPQHRELAHARPPWVVEEPPETSPPGSRRSWSGSPRPSPRCTGLPAQGRTPAGPPTRPPEMTHGSVRRAVFRRVLVARPFTGPTGARRAHR